MSMEETTLERFIRVSSAYGLSDEIARTFFLVTVAQASPDMREILEHPAWALGFISGMLYAKRRADGLSTPAISRADVDVLHKIVVEAIKSMSQVPYVGERN